MLASSKSDNLLSRQTTRTQALWRVLTWHKIEELNLCLRVETWLLNFPPFTNERADSQNQSKSLTRVPWLESASESVAKLGELLTVVVRSRVQIPAHQKNARQHSFLVLIRAGGRDEKMARICVRYFWRVDIFCELGFLKKACAFSASSMALVYSTHNLWIISFVYPA